MKLCELLDAVDTIKETGAADVDIKSVADDSRVVVPGALFVCLCGNCNDGHNHICEAVAAGAVAVVAEYENEELLACGLPYAIVTNSRRAAAYLHARFWGDPQKALVIIGVTGTNGKSSTVCMLETIFREAGMRTGMIGTITDISAGTLLPKGTMTTPDPAELYRILRRMADDGVTHVFMEASSHALELDKLAPITFEAAVFTNLTQDHLDFHNTMEAYFIAKAKLFDSCRHAVINLDDEWGKRLYGMLKCDRVGYSATGIGDYYAEDICCDSPDGVSYSFCGRQSVYSPIPGGFTIYNTLAAMSCAEKLGISSEVSARAISKLRGVRGRIERVELPSGCPIDVFIDYAHTPDALEKLLQSVRAFSRGRRITLIMGCGGDRDRGKRPLMGAIASRLADLLVITSDNSRSEFPADIIHDIMRGVDRERPYIVIESRAAAIRYAVTTARSGDIILIAGKGHEEYEITSDGMRPFSERERVLAAAEERRDAKRG